MIHRVLIANRGEIAVRIIRACQELGKTAIAVYSDADRTALHVQRADEAYRIGPASPEASYLNIPAIIEAARKSRADAIHPGYGFISENPLLAEACQEAGIVFIGPSPRAMRAMGDKAAAKAIAKRAGVPTVPGYVPRRDPRRSGASGDAPLLRAAGRVGYPLLVKASAGGGGRGMRVVEHQEQLREAVESARREAVAAFGDGHLLLERYVHPARHIEVQVLGDGHGRAAALGERECSLQRRHQKVVEEAPAPNLDPNAREGMLHAAERLATAIGYVSTGTMEFILAPDGQFYFLEMNTRLQVEHGVTELVTGLDLVQLQIRIAEGEPLPADVPAPRGHAIECRIYAEDPLQGFRPSPGRLLIFEPPDGPGIRNDVGVYAGDEVTPYYDPQLAKLLVHAADRPSALGRLRTALDGYTVAGVASNLGLLRAIVRDQAFEEARVHTRFLEETLLPSLQGPPAACEVPEEVLIAAAALDAAAGPRSTEAGGNPWQTIGRSGLAGSNRRFSYRLGDTSHEVRLARTADGWAADAGRGPRNVSWQTTGGSRLVLQIDGRILSVHAMAERDRVVLAFHGETFILSRPLSDRLNPGSFTRSGGEAQRGLTAPMPALVARVLVREGESVVPRQTLVVLQAMKMEHLIQAPTGGRVQAVRYREGESVPEGAVLVEIAPDQ